MLYQATKNLTFSKLGKSVIVGETVELETSYADEINKNLKLTFPDVDAVLVPVDGEVPKPQKTGRKKTAKTEKVEPAEESDV